MLERQKHGQPNEVQHKTDKRYCNNERKKLISPSNVVQWAGSGTLEIEGTTVLYSGLSEPKNGDQRGVAIALKGDLRKA